ncbi:MAG TPA: hypothetical protein ENN07_00455 [candidate division Zixibacteria bacterium]|nr:hypothetical protein [candidate division Zixibacteria bacterium]
MTKDSIHDIFKKKSEELKELKENLLKRRYTRMDEEVWRPIENAPLYEVSNWGRVRSWKRRGRVAGKADEPVILNQSAKQTGEMVVNIHFEGKFKSIQVKRLVYDTFRNEERHPNTVIVHRDGDKGNNRLDNLILAKEFIDLPDSAVVAIRKEFADGAKKRALCRKYDISIDDLEDLLYGRKAKWLGGPIAKGKYRRKLAPEEIEEIAKRALSGEESIADIAEHFNVRESRVVRILEEAKSSQQ